nr:hypothetical protein GCM10020092_055770 [Actinoplanes digitatis]
MDDESSRRSRRAPPPSAAAQLSQGVDQAAGGTREVPPLGQRQQRVAVAGRGRQGRVEGRQRHVQRDPAHRQGGRQVVAGTVQLDAQARREPGVLVVERGQDLLDAAVARDQAGRGLLADAGHARQAVARVAPHRGEVRIPPGRHAVFGLDRRVVAVLELGDPAPAVEQPRAARVVDQLEQVAVARDDLDRGGLGGGERAQHIVGLVASHPERRDAHRGEHLEQDRDLLLQGRGHLLDGAVRDAVPLVGRDERDPPG